MKQENKYSAPSLPQGTLQRVSCEPHQCPFTGPSDPVRSGGAGDSHYTLPTFSSPAHGWRGSACLPGQIVTEAERRGTLGTEYCPQKKVAEGRILMELPDPALSSSSSTNKAASYGLGFLVVLLPGLSI